MNIVFRLVVLLFALLTATAGAQTLQTFELRAAPPLAGRTLNVIEPNGGSYSIGTFSLSQAGSWSGNAWSGKTHAVLSGMQLSLDENFPEQVWTFEAGGRTAQITYADLQAALPSLLAVQRPTWRPLFWQTINRNLPPRHSVKKCNRTRMALS